MRVVAAFVLALVGCRPEPMVEPAEPEPEIRETTQGDVVPPPSNDRPCTSEADCPEGQGCRSPEAASWNFCGAEQSPNCPEGQIGDSCGNCFVACSESIACPEGMTCNGSYCESPRRCSVVHPPPP